MYAGAYQLGDEFVVTFTTTIGDGSPRWPDEAPTVDLWHEGEDLLETVRAAPVERYRQTGIFAFPVFLGFEHEVGHYAAVIRYTVSSYLYHHVVAFEVMDGGDPDGSNIALREYRKAGGNFVIQHRRSGRIASQRNPQVA